MALSQMQVFNEYVMPASVETLAQMVQKFNEASAGAIRLTTEGFTGDFLQESFFAAVHSAQRRVDRYAAQAAATPTDLTQIKLSGVKVAGGFGPIRFEPSQLTWLNKPTTEGIEVASRNFAEALMRDQLNTAIAALKAAIANQATATFDYSATGGLSYSVINNAHAKFGDASGNLVAQVMNGQAYHKLIGANLTNAQQLFQSTNVLVVNILGKPAASKDAIGKPKGTQLKVSVTAAPKDGKATDHMVRFLAPQFGVAVSAVDLGTGPGALDRGYESDVLVVEFFLVAK